MAGSIQALVHCRLPIANSAIHRAIADCGICRFGLGDCQIAAMLQSLDAAIWNEPICNRRIAR
jgi:hypothetical protein